MPGSGYGLVDQFCRAGELQPHFFRRCQREFRDDVLPTLAFVDECGGVEAIRAALAERDALKVAQTGRIASAKPAKETADVA